MYIVYVVGTINKCRVDHSRNMYVKHTHLKRTGLRGIANLFSIAIVH